MSNQYPPTESRLEELREEGHYPHCRSLVRLLSLAAVIGVFSAFLPTDLSALSIKEVIGIVVKTAALLVVSVLVFSGIFSQLECGFKLGRKRFNRAKALTAAWVLHLLTVSSIVVFAILYAAENEATGRLLRFSSLAILMNCTLICGLEYFLNYMSFRRRYSMTKQEILAEDG